MNGNLMETPPQLDFIFNELLDWKCSNFYVRYTDYLVSSFTRNLWTIRGFRFIYTIYQNAQN